MTSKKLREKYTDDSFKNIEELRRFFRSGKTLKYDYLIVGGILYTMHEYDMEGKYIDWANKKHDTLIRVETSDRYSDTGFLDAETYLFENYGAFRNDIAFAE